MDEVKTTETPQATESPEPRQPQEPQQPAELQPPLEPPNELKQFTKLGEDIGDPVPSQPVKSPVVPPLQPPPSEEPSGFAQFLRSLLATQVSQRTGLVIVTVFLAMMTLLILSYMPRRVVQDKSADRTLESLTPELVAARCGPPAEDVTKDLYPMMTRTMSYKPTGLGSVVLEFTRTSEETSQWLFLSMKDGTGTIKYQTTEMQFAALPCLASKK
jgi:hypothetical protein